MPRTIARRPSNIESSAGIYTAFSGPLIFGHMRHSSGSRSGMSMKAWRISSLKSAGSSLRTAIGELGSRDNAARFLETVKLCSLGESLGGIETLISHPATMTHAGYTQPERDALGITDGLVRISVGCEDVEDLITDLRGALETI